MIPQAVDPYSNTKQLVDLTNNSIGSETSRILKSKVFKVVSGSLVIMAVSAWALHKFLNMKNKKVVVLSKPGFIFNTEQDHLRTNSSPRQDLWVDIEPSTDDEGELTFMSTTSSSEDSFEVLSSAESHLTKNSDLDLSPQSVSQESSLSTILDSSQENDNPQN